MGRRLRLLDNESGIVELTSRCLHGRYLMRPSSKSRELTLGVIGRAQRLSGIRLYAFIYLSNHMHALAGADSVRQVAAYQRFVNGNLSKKLGAELGWNERFWGKRYHSACLADDERDQQKRLRYLLSNGCKENLVDSPLEWPGVSTAWALSRGIWTLEGTWVDRTSRRSGAPVVVTETVELSPLPFMEGWSRREQQQWVLDAIREIEKQTRQRHRADGTRALGVRRVLRQNPFEKPAEFHPAPAPLFHATSPAERRKLRYARAQTEAAYREAAAKLKQGETDVEFPEDCFPPPFVNTKRGPPKS